MTQTGSKSRPPGGRRRAYWILAALAAVLAGGCAEEQEKQQRPPARVETVRVEARTFRETVRGIGSVQAMETVEVTAEVAALVEKIHHEEGRPVRSGALLVTLDDDKLRRRLHSAEAALAGAEAKLAGARSDWQIVRDLYEQDAATEAEYDHARANLDAARAEVDRSKAEIELIREQLEDTRIHAPIDGTLAEWRIDVGDFVTVGRTLVRLYSLSPVEVAFTLPGRYAGRVEPNQPVEVTVDAWPKRLFSGKVTFVAPDVRPATRDFLVKARLPNEDRLLKAGAFATARVIVNVCEGCPSLPADALVATREGYDVFVIEDGKAHRRTVDVGLRRPGYVQITDGLSIGETVVQAGQMRLSDGDRVQVASRPETATPPETRPATHPAPRSGAER